MFMIRVSKMEKSSKGYDKMLDGWELISILIIFFVAIGLIILLENIYKLIMRIIFI